MKSSFGSSFSSSFKKAKQPKEERVFETGGSNFEKIMEVLNRPGGVSRQVAQNVNAGENPLKGTSDILLGKKEAPTGAETFRELSGAPVPDTKLGRAAQAVAGFALEVVNPADPLNWIGVGEVKNTARGLEKLGQLAKFTEGLKTGERSLVSAKIPFIDKAIPLTPSFVDRGAGSVLQGFGQAARAIPGVEAAGKFLKPTFTKLAKYTNKADAQAAQI